MRIKNLTLIVLLLSSFIAKSQVQFVSGLSWKYGDSTMVGTVEYYAKKDIGTANAIPKEGQYWTVTRIITAPAVIVEYVTKEQFDSVVTEYKQYQAYATSQIEELKSRIEELSKPEEPVYNGPTEKKLSFTYELPTDAVTSAGIYRGETLVRTLWNNKKTKAGTYTEKWTPLDDEHRTIEDATGLTVQVLANNIKSEWLGVIGNTSKSSTGSSVHRSFSPIEGITIDGNYGYYNTGYNEGGLNQAKFDLTDINTRIPLPNTGARVLNSCSDGEKVYWAASDWRAGTLVSPINHNLRKGFVFATKISDDKQYVFPNGVAYSGAIKMPNVISIFTGVDQKVSLAVQRDGDLLFVARADSNSIEVLNKRTGVSIETLWHENPIAIKVSGDLLFVANKSQVIAYNIGNGIAPSSQSYGGAFDIKNISISPDGNTLMIADGGNSQQIKKYDIKTGEVIGVFGQFGGYLKNGATVLDDKFYWDDLNFDHTVALDYAPDGSYWVSDNGNERLRHFSSDNKFIEEIGYLSHSYSAFVCNNNTKRVFSDYMEFEVDYTKQVTPNTGFWKLVRNWAAFFPPELDDQKNRLKGVTKLSNGKTYAVLQVVTENSLQVIELTDDGEIVFLQRIKCPSNISKGKYLLYEDGCIRVSPYTNMGVPQVWRSLPLLGYDENGNPVWEDISRAKIIASSPNRIYADPATNNTRRSAEITSSNLLIAYEGSAPDINDKKYHLGAIKIGDDGKWLWRTMPQTFKEYTGQFPSDGYYDIGNSVQYAGYLKHYALDRFILTGYNGEFWKGSQTNMYNLFYDNLKIEFNAWSWIRNICKYGDQFLQIDHHPDYGVMKCLPMPVNEVEREEGYDPQNPFAYRFRWATQGNRVLEPWQIVHLRMLGNDSYLPYGAGVLEAARRIWRHTICNETRDICGCNLITTNRV